MQLNMLEAMNIYVNVVEQGSFIRAAEVLELHRPAVTRAVQNLEHDLGVKLLHRTTRQVSMTDEGEEFYQRCLSLLSELDDVRRLFSRTQPPKGRLRLDVPITLARAVIIPALGDFQNRYPDIEMLAAVVYLIAGHSNMLGEVATPQRVTDIIHSLESLYHFNIVLILPPVIVLWGAIRKKPVIPLMLSACVLALFLGVIMQGLSIKQGLDAFIDGFDIAMFPQGAEGVVADVPRLLNRGGMFSMMGTILLVFCAFSFAGALTLTGALTIIINRLLTIIHSVGQLIAATIGTTILVTGATSDGKLALLVPAELFKDAYRRMGLDTKNLSRTIEDAGTVIEPLLPWTSAGVYMATTLGVSTLDLLPWAIQCYAAIFFALIYGFSGIGIARTASASEKSPQASVTK